MPKHRRRSDYDDDGDDSSEEDRNQDSGSKSDDDNDDDDRKHSKKKKHKKHSSKRKHKKKHHKKRSRRKDDEESSRSSDDDDDDSEHSQSRHKKRKKVKKRRKRPRRETETATSSDDDANNKASSSSNQNSHSHILTQALCRLFSARPVFAQELPILLIRLAGGATFDLGQMNDAVAATALEGVLECLQEFGVQRSKGSGEWLFQAPPGLRDERALLRVIRSLLDDVGVTMRAVGDYNAKLEEEKNNIDTKPVKNDAIPSDKNKPQADPDLDRIKDMMSNVILKYQSKDAELGSQFAGLCQTIATGESISIDGLPDETLKASLEEIFVACGLEKSEMADDDDDDDDEASEGEGDDTGPTMGYCLPEEASNSDKIQFRLAAVMEACRNPKRRVLGPTRPTQQEAATTYNSEDEDEGPALPGQERRRPRGPTLPEHVLKAQAEYRELELKATAAGISVPTDGGGREEWMIVPGKFDFMSNIKSGQPMKSRGFENKKTRGGEGGAAEAPIHPAIQAEMDAIMQAHQEHRGPSLIDQHRSKMKQEKMEAAGKEEGWKWSRDKDLDEGRRVDKDALHQVLGGAANNLKTKFHGSFN
jgi:hypothetical protein